MKQTILIVEDEPANQRLFRDLFESRGYAVISATDGLQAVDMAMRQVPHLILMDIGLPGVSGLDATRMIKANESTGHIPVVALTAFAMKEDEDRASQAGCDGFLSKPVDIKVLLGEVARRLSSAESGLIMAERSTPNG